jgi:hypothetical protein
MATHHKASFPCKIHLYVKHNMATNFLKANKLRLFVFSYFLWSVPIMCVPHYLYSKHFLNNCLPPKSVPVVLSISNASCTVFGKWIPNLWVVLQYHNFSLEIIRFLLLIMCGTHHLKAGSLTSLFTTAYSATSTGLEAFRSASFSQLVNP